MEIERGSEPLIAFLLVDQADHVSPAAGAEPPALVSTAGRPFAPANNEVVEIGEGWYSLRLAKNETADLGPLIVVAQGDETSAWRDIHYVVERKTGDGEIRIDEIAEAAVALIDPEVIAAGIEQEVTSALGRARLGLVIGPPVE